MRVLLYKEEYAKEDILGAEPAKSLDYDDPVKAVLEGTHMLDGVEYKSALLTMDDGTPRAYYWWNYKTARHGAQRFYDADAA